MDIETALVAHLESDAGVAAVVAARVYPLQAPQEATLPFVVYQRLNTGREAAHDGPTGLAMPMFQLTCVGGSYASVKAVAKAVRQALDGFRGVMGGFGGVMVFSCDVENEFDDSFPVLDQFLIYVSALMVHEED